MAKKCCPRIRVACKKVGGETVSQTYWTLKSPLNKPVKHTATAHIPARTKCAVALGKRVVGTYVPWDSRKIDKDIERYKKSLTAQGCADVSADLGRTVKVKDPTFSKNASGDVLDRLKKKVAAKTSR